MNAADFLQALYGNVATGWLETTFIAPKELRVYPRTVVLWRELPLGTFDAAMPKLHGMNQCGYGCYYGVAVRRERKYPQQRIVKKTGEKYTCRYPRGSERDAVYLTAFYADADAKDYGGDFAQARARIDILNPSLTIGSGGGFHALLLLDTPLEITDANRADVKRTLKGIAKHIGSDPSVAELARVLRLPETINTKPERQGARCQVVAFQDTRYSYADLFMRFAPLIPQAIPRTGGARFEGDTRSDVTDALQCIPADSISYHDWITVLAALYHDLDEHTAISLAEQWSGWCSNPGEIEDKLESFAHGASVTTAHLGSLFHFARQFGYIRQNTFTTTSKRRVRDHIAQLQGGTV